MKKLILILSLLISSILVDAQSDIINQLKVDNKTELSLYFYPSTLRMLNLQHNEEFNDMVKDIKKMSFLKLDKNIFDVSQFMEVVLALQSDEGLEEYIVVDGKEQKLYLLGSESPTSTVAMAFFQNEYYAIDIAGSINMAELPKLYEQLSQGDEALKNDFADIFDLIEDMTGFGQDRRGRRKNIKEEIDD